MGRRGYPPEFRRKVLDHARALVALVTSRAPPADSIHMIEHEAVAHAKFLDEVMAALLADNLRRFEEGMESIARHCETEASDEGPEQGAALLQAA